MRITPSPYSSFVIRHSSFVIRHSSFDIPHSSFHNSTVTKKQPHPLLDLALTVILPSLALEKLSAPERLGPLWALIVALLLPLGFGIWCFVNKRGMNFFSILGLTAVIVTGVLGLWKLNATWFAAKEAMFPLFLGIAFPLSHRWGRPLVNDLLLNPQMINHPALHQALDTPEKHHNFAILLKKASWGMAGTMIFSSAMNFALALYLLGDKTPGSEEYTKAIGRLNWSGSLILMIPLMAVLLALMFWVLRSISRITGLERDDLLNQGTTVRKQVNNG
ncbi:VC0807 family protein [Prosthecobacter sp.]|uniref:VC0807 family protein n=1 Tax=Prosthecobacter sp. TaxID=1965333 RepID=UPI003783BC85